ncbi:MAG: ABC transporter substrate-binding protein [Methanomicrobia archaeon]|nr:ABC transporter substrate-binding protein [Methanomicrobia archaeon]
MSTRTLVGFFTVMVFCYFCTVCAASSVTPWNSVTKDASENVSFDLYLDEYAEVEFSVTADLSYRWTWAVNGEVIKETEGTSSNFEYAIDDYGSYAVTVRGTSVNETLQASWNLTVWLVLEKENDIRELEGLEDYVLRLPKKPERIVSMAPSCTEFLFAVGAGDQVVGVTEYCDYPPEVVEKKNHGEIAVIGGYSTPSFEKIVALQPDLVVGAYGNPDDVLYWLVDESAHQGVTYPLYAQNPKNVEEIFQHLMVLGALTGCRAEADSLEYELRNRVAAITAETASLTEEEKPRVFYNIGDFFTAGDNTFVNEVITLAGGTNIAADSSGYFVMNLEELIYRNPQVIICDSSMVSMSLAYEQIMEDKRLQILDAVKNGWVYVIDADIIDRPSPRIVDALELVYQDYSDFFVATRPTPSPAESSSSAADGSSAKAASTATAPSAAASSPQVTETARTVPVLKAGEDTAMLFEDMDISLLTLSSDTTVNDVRIAIKRVERPPNVPAPPDTTYVYLDLSVTPEEVARVSGSIEFKVRQSWLAAHNIEESTVRLSRYDERAGWSKLSTSRVGVDDLFVIFEAETPDFSLFAITGEQQSRAERTTSPSAAPPATPQSSNESSQAAPSPLAATPESETSAAGIPGFEAIGAAIALLVLTIHRRGSNYNPGRDANLYDTHENRKNKEPWKPGYEGR